MKIEDYSFGKITIKGRTYTSDLLICGEELKTNWWREEGHSLCLDDLSWVISRKPDLLVVGTGKSGRMQVPAGVKDQLEQKSIEVAACPTSRAVEVFNQQQGGQKAAAGFHLSC